jgi:death on curing protein
VNQHHKPDGDIAELAAAYAFGLAKNHPFVDGNKRTAFLALGLFVALNGWSLETTLNAIETVLSLATGTLDESALANWIRGRIQPAK